VSTIDRLRDIVRGSVPRQTVVRELTYEPVGPDGLPVERGAATALRGASDVGTPFGPVAVIDHAFETDWPFLGTSPAECEVIVPGALSTLTGRPVTPRPARRGGPVFLDLETTGLSGGAGTVAFLVGCGFFENGTFRTRQFFLTGYAGERALLHLVAGFLAEAPFIVTYNGRTFDLPVMEMRWQFHRIPPPLDDLPHVDMLPPARRLWRAGEDGADRSCRLVHLEESLLGYAREGDVPGWEIPQRYFDYVRRGDPAPLEPVLLHNRLDLVSLAAITARAQRLVEEGPSAARDPCECVALGRIFRRAGALDRAEASFRHAASQCGTSRAVREDALHELAMLLRRQRRFGEAAEAWRDLLALGHGRSRAAREAIQALAVHQEHRERNLQHARELATRALQAEQDPSRREDLRYRLARIQRKLAALGHEPAVQPGLIEPGCPRA
jgi:hypothetical protein